MLRSLIGAVLGGAAGWAIGTIALAQNLATITTQETNFVNAVAIGCGAVAGSILGATSAVTDMLRARPVSAAGERTVPE